MVLVGCLQELIYVPIDSIVQVAKVFKNTQSSHLVIKKIIEVTFIYT